eukprot:1111266-Prymnesium_polylepis.1
MSAAAALETPTKIRLKRAYVTGAPGSRARPRTTAWTMASEPSSRRTWRGRPRSERTCGSRRH